MTTLSGMASRLPAPCSGGPMPHRAGNPPNIPLSTGTTANTWEDLEDEDGSLGTSVRGEDEQIPDKSNRKERAVGTPR